MTRLTATMLVGLVLAIGLAVTGANAEVPYVALGPGPTFDTLGQADGTTVVDVSGRQTYPTTGHLNMTTVSVTDGLTLFGAMGRWFSGRYGLVPRDAVFPPDRTAQQTDAENARQFAQSGSDAEIAALEYLHIPTTVSVGAVTGGSPADSRLQAGDRLLQVNGVPVATAQGVVDALAGSRPGQSVAVRYQRADAAPQQIDVVLATRPGGGQQGFLGVTPHEQPDMPLTITIRLADIGGPSAGLMFALAIVDKLTPGELTGGRFVAGTGEIRSDGRVQPIGGIPYKMAAARAAGAAVFLVPTENCAEAASRAPDGLRLVKVGSVAEAVAALDALRAGQDPAEC